MTTGPRRARPPADFPPDAADAEPLNFAFVKHSDAAFLRQLLRDAERVLQYRSQQRSSRHNHRDGRHVKGKEEDAIRELAKTCNTRWDEATAAFAGKLLTGELTAWGRPGSLTAPPQAIPATAWKVLRLEPENLRLCIASGRRRGPV